MIYDYKQVLKFFGSPYQIRRAIKEEKLFKIESGIYSYNNNVNALSVLMKKYPNAIITSETAYYFHRLTDVIPSKIMLATGRNNSKIHDKRVKQIFISEQFLNIGKTTIKVNGVVVNIFDKEKLLIELIKNKKKTSFDYYKEIINSYRNIRDELDIKKIEQYLELYPQNEELYKTIISEVF